MKFRSKEELDSFLSTLKFIGEGCQGLCFLDKKTNQVYKIYSEYYYDLEDAGYTDSDIMEFGQISNSTFIWPNGVVMVGNMVVGYTHSYVNAKNFCEFKDPFKVNLDNLSYAVYKANEDIKLLTDNGVKIYDLMYNLMYDGKRIKVIDTADFWKGVPTYLENVEYFNDEIKMFLVDCYFNNIVLNDERLYKLYKGNTSALTFLREFRLYLEKIKKQEIKYLGQARDLANVDFSEHQYEREIIKGVRKTINGGNGYGI